MELIFLGTGTSQGLPLVAHPNSALDLKNPCNWRTRSSVHVNLGGHRIQVDAAPEFRLQCLREGIDWIDAFILTHGHSDHLMGMDDLRRFCELRQGKLPVYASKEEGMQRVRSVFYYAIKPEIVQVGYPVFDLSEMPKCLQVPGGSVYSTALPHGRIEVLGLVFEEKETGKRLAYYSDCHEVPKEAADLAQGVDVLVIDGLRHEPHPTHMTVASAIAISKKIGARETYLTHIGACMDHATEEAKLPPSVHMAYDGLRLLL